MKCTLKLVVFATSLCLSISTNAGYLDCRSAYDKKEYGIALTVCMPLANQGHAKAQNVIGLMYDTGHGVAQNVKLALKWYRLSADQGYAIAQSNLGYMYANGLCVSKDDKVATRVDGV